MHHAILLVGEVVEAKRFIEEYFGTLRGSPDFFFYNQALFGIDEARELTIAAVRKAFTGRKIFLLAPDRITIEAENALLKTFEDPTPDTHFFLCVREESLIIPTLRSRMITWRLDRQGAVQPPESDAKKFLKLPLKERLNFAKKFADAEKNISIFLDELLIILKESNKTEGLKEVYPLRLESDGRAVSARLILEHLSLVLPG